MVGIVRIHMTAVGQQRLIHDNGVGTRVGRGKVQFFRVGIAIGVRGRHRNVGVGAIFLDFENEVAVLTGNDDVAVRPGFSLRKLAQIGAAGSIAADFCPRYGCSLVIIRVHGKGRTCSGIVVRAEGNRNRVDILLSVILDFHRCDHRPVVGNDHGHLAGIPAAIHIRHGHGKIMGNMRVHAVETVLQSIVVQRVGERQLARGRVEARHGQRAFIRGYGVSGKRAVFKHGHLALGHVAVRIRVGVGDLFRPRVAVGERLHLRVVIVELIAVGAVFVQREFAVPALLIGIRPRKVRAIRTGHSALKGIADDGIGIPFRHRLLKALDGGHVVGDLDTDHGRAAVAVPVRHHHCHFVGDGIVFAASV